MIDNLRLSKMKILDASRKAKQGRSYCFGDSAGLAGIFYRVALELGRPVGDLENVAERRISCRKKTTYLQSSDPGDTRLDVVSWVVHHRIDRIRLPTLG